MLTSYNDSDMTPARKTAMLMLHPLRLETTARFALAIVSLLASGFLLLYPAFVALAVFVFICALASELLERSLFFRAVAAPKMPGGVY